MIVKIKHVNGDTTEYKQVAFTELVEECLIINGLKVKVGIPLRYIHDWQEINS